MKLKRSVFFSVIITILASTSQAEDYHTNCIPKNNLRISSTDPLQSGITKEEFNSIMDAVEKVYSPIMASLGAKLKLNRRWDDNAVDASAMRFGTTWVVNMYGGMARHKDATPDAVTVIACHEVGHHMGGQPRDAWFSAEGQADYFSSLKCLRKVWANDDNEAIVEKMSVPQSVKQKCLSQFENKASFAICIRSAMGGMALANLLSNLRGEKKPQFETPDSNVVPNTIATTVNSQCRLDTFFMGSVCNIDPNIDIGETDPNVGVCSRKIGHLEGARPRCWYRD